jgi:hypothetical protein
MEHFFIRVWDDLVGRSVGPMHFRLILQPVMAGILGIRAGLREPVKINRPILTIAAISRGREPRISPASLFLL